MGLLLDTHALIRWDSGDGLSEAVQDAIRSADPFYVSAVTAWEIAIEIGLGRIRTTRRVDDAVADSGSEALPVRLRHTQRLLDLPLHHRDPFDRMRVAQAQDERLTMVTRDPAVRLYDVRLLEC